MQKRMLIGLYVVFTGFGIAFAEGQFETDTIKTASGDLKITFIGHGTLMFSFNANIIHIDPWGKLADYSKLPKADMILVTHDHRDHLDLEAIQTLRTDKTVILLTEACARQLKSGTVMKNGDVQQIGGLTVEAIEAYNLAHKRDDGNPYHPKGAGNGYVITFGDRRVYIAGDTENIPEMKKLEKIDVAFLPMNLPYTMTPEMVADAATAFKPKILYPYHFGETDTTILTGLLKSDKQIEARIRNLK